MADPAVVYGERLDQRRRAVRALERRDQIIANLRLIVFVTGLGAAGAWLLGGVSPHVLAIPGAAFAALVVWHQIVHGALTRARLAVDYYEAGLRRLSGTWQGRGRHAHAAPPDHPCAADLDLFGEGSLFELLCTTQTRIGEDVLARWLIEAPQVGPVRARQRAVQALAGGVERRERQHVVAAGQRTEIDAERLNAWVSGPPMFRTDGSLRLGATVLSLVAFVGLALWFLTELGPWPLLAILTVQWGVGRITRARLENALGPIASADARLGVLARCLDGYARASWDPGLLSEHRIDLHDAAVAIARLQRLVQWLDAERNQLFKPIAFVLMWRLQFVLAIERWRFQHQSQLATWLHAFGTVEALDALATYAYEHPSYPYPELLPLGVEASGHGPSTGANGREPAFDGVDLRHPLLERGIANSVRLDREAPVLIVSGSNMSGKSTLLRTVGVNAVLAYCGAPVCATSLRLSPLAIGATLHIQDSLQRGRSRFFAEITRLKQLADMAVGPVPLLFLLDEVLHGTNSHDRRIGARAVLEKLVGCGAIGLVTTHDLALVEIASAIHGRNVHFADELRGGEMHFDYKLRDGVVEHSNALALMQVVGLSV